MANLQKYSVKESLNQMVYDTGLVVTAVHAGSDQALGATYSAIYVGVGGDVVVTLSGSKATLHLKT